ncbi:alpha/beta hydrolase family protein [Streptomyces bacillaris]|uniref:alpha/beta hydrolase family protein n=1 Tax=Streptomyces bacillaris TaxID=68179 RepID=UPI00362EE582
MSIPAFMSPEHIEAMRGLLHGEPAVLAVCRDLDRRYGISYVLTDGPGGEEIHWQMTFDPVTGVHVELGDPDHADVVYRGDWATVMLTAAARRRGEAPPDPLVVDGDPAVLDRIGPAFASAHRVAAIETSLPDVDPLPETGALAGSGDIRGTAVWSFTERAFRAVHEPAFGRPHRLSEPDASPDGARIALTGAVFDELEGLPRTGAYHLAADGLRALDPGDGSRRSPRFSPDGRQVALLTDEAEPGVFQVAILSGADLDHRTSAPDVPGTVEYLAWSPDGSAVLLGVAGRGADLAGGQGSGTIREQPADRPDWAPSVDDGVPADIWRSVHVFDLASGELCRWSPADVNVWEAAWLGTDAIVAVTSPSPDEGAWYTAALTRIRRDGTTTRLHTPRDQLGRPAGSPDGDAVAVVEAIASDRWVVAGDLLAGAPGALARVDTLGVDVTATHWIDERRLGFAGVRGLETVLAVHDRTTGTTTQLWASADTGCGMPYPQAGWTAAGDAVIVEEGYRVPQRLVTVPGDGNPPRVLHRTDHPGTDRLLDLAGTAQPVSWHSSDGLRIEGLLCLPPGEGPFPLVVNIHGGPVWAYRNQWSMFSMMVPVLVSRGYAVLNPNPRGSSGRGRDFTRRVLGDPGGLDGQDILSGVDALVGRGIADPARVGLMGGSYGGYLSSWLVTQDQRWAAAVPVAPVTDWYSQHFTSNIPSFDQLLLGGGPERDGAYAARSPLTHVASATTPCLLVAGALDRCTPPTQAQEFHRGLRENGTASVLVVYPREGHGVRAFPACIDYTARVLGWFERHMPAKAGNRRTA